jgi:S-adenosylmethionine hydrolase
MSPRVVGLLTDFGHRDPFVGAMKAVMVGINPALQLIDISHDIAPQAMRQAALILTLTYAYFPSGSIFVVVVDPGVGSARRAIVAETERYRFVGPDNGVFGPVLEREPARRVVEIREHAYCRRPISRTFHGRDIFAPVAAWLSRGVDAGAMGPAIDDYLRLTLPQPRLLADGTLEGEVLYEDRFGNLMTNVSETWVAEHWGPPPWTGVVARIGPSAVRGLDTSYAERPPQALGLIFNSWGLLEVFANRAHAGQLIGAGVGTPVKVWRERP